MGVSSLLGAEESWREEADRRIEAIRKGDFVLHLKDDGGQALGLATVSVRQTGNHFRFGTAWTGNPLSQRPEEQRYRQFVLETFNTLVSENDMKWYSIEAQLDRIRFERADRVMDFAANHGLAMRGHTLFWAKEKWTQDWVKQLDDATLRAAMEAHLTRTVERYRGRLIAWDVNNEMLTGSFFKDRLGEDIRVWMFQRAHQLDPDTPLFVNEYALLCDDAKTDRYIALIKDLMSKGAPIHGIGVQEHAVERFAADEVAAAAEADTPERTSPAGPLPLIPRQVWARLDRLAALGLPIHLTEISVRTSDQQRRADTLEMMMRTAFAHHGVEAFLMWGFWANRHWLGPNAGLVAEDWTLLPAGERLRHLILETWRTRTESQSNAAGTMSFRGFYGTYAVEARTADGRLLQGTVALIPDSLTHEVVLAPAP